MTLHNDDPIGTYSLRKLAATYAANNGCSRGNIHYRGRWRMHKRIVDIFFDVTLAYPDAKEAATLAVGGPVNYHVNTDADIADDWIKGFTDRSVGGQNEGRVAENYNSP